MTINFSNNILHHGVSRFFYRCEAGSLTRKKHGSRMFVNRVLRVICGLEREEVGGGLRRVCNEEIHKLHMYPNIIRVIMSRKVRWDVHTGF
jgi:hypothetical protein